MNVTPVKFLKDQNLNTTEIIMILKGKNYFRIGPIFRKIL